MPWQSHGTLLAFRRSTQPQPAARGRFPSERIETIADLHASIDGRKYILIRARSITVNNHGYCCWSTDLSFDPNACFVVTWDCSTNLAWSSCPLGSAVYCASRSAHARSVVQHTNDVCSTWTSSRSNTNESAKEQLKRETGDKKL